MMRPRVIIGFVILLLLAPVSIHGMTAGDYRHVNSTDEASVQPPANQHITFVSAQGGQIRNGDGLYAVNTTTKDIVWKHTSAAGKYFDIDLINNSTILFTATHHVKNGKKYHRVYVVNWRENVTLDSWSVPYDTHDVDYLGNEEYAVADIRNDRVYVYNRSSDTVVWEYDFRKHFSRQVGGGQGDWTHVNDIDAVRNGSAFLVSPRNFDRVLLINRSSKEIEWTLGEEDNTDIIYEQHNPVLLSTEPPTVLVADSENDRVVEYVRVNGSWKRSWVYSEGLSWPRDADRLPNGNTLIVDSENHRVLEVTPDKEVVWEMPVKKWPYDIERLQYGDEPQGPPMHSMLNLSIGEMQSADEDIDQNGGLVSAWEGYYKLSKWVLPAWISLIDFTLLAVATVLTSLWFLTEVGVAGKRFVENARW